MAGETSLENLTNMLVKVWIRLWKVLDKGTRTTNLIFVETNEKWPREATTHDNGLDGSVTFFSKATDQLHYINYFGSSVFRARIKILKKNIFTYFNKIFF